MNDNPRNESDIDDAVILEWLEAADLDRVPGSDALAPSDRPSGRPDNEAGSREDRLRREYLEVLGLLPYELEPVAPAAETKQRILAAVGGSSTEEGRPASGPRVARGPRVVAPGGRGWLLPLAASLALVLMAVSGWLVLQVRAQRVLIADLSARLDQGRSTEAALVASRGMLAEARSRLDMMTAPGTQFCALRPPEGSLASGALGVVVMHPAGEDWFLRIEGLEPCSQGRKYVVWFSTESGEVPGPVFAVKNSGETVELSLTDQPPGIEAIMITLEADPTPQAPSMKPLLFGDERTQLL